MRSFEQAEPQFSHMCKKTAMISRLVSELRYLSVPQMWHHVIWVMQFLLSEDTFPRELQTYPVPLVGFVGLDMGADPVHKAVWDAFTLRNDSSPMNVVIFTAQHEFPKPKPKVKSFWHSSTKEFYVICK